MRRFAPAAMSVAAALGVALIPAHSAAVPLARAGAPADLGFSAVSFRPSASGRVKIDAFKMVPWRDARERRRFAAVVVVRYPRALSKLPKKRVLRSKLDLTVRDRKGALVAQAHDVMQVPIRRPGARPRVMHVLRFSPRQGKRLRKHTPAESRRRAAARWDLVAAAGDHGAGRSDVPLDTRLDVAMAAGSQRLVTDTIWYPLPNPFELIRQAQEREASCRAPLLPNRLEWDAWAHVEYLACLATGSRPTGRGLPEAASGMSIHICQPGAEFRQLFLFLEDVSPWAARLELRTSNGQVAAFLPVEVTGAYLPVTPFSPLVRTTVQGEHWQRPAGTRIDVPQLRAMTIVIEHGVRPFPRHDPVECPFIQ